MQWEKSLSKPYIQQRSSLKHVKISQSSVVKNQIVNIEEMTKRLVETNIQGNIRYEKLFSASLAIKEIQIKITISHYLPATVAKVKNTDNTKCWGGCEETITYMFLVGF